MESENCNFTLKIRRNPKLCENKCGFYTPDTIDYCSVCVTKIKSSKSVQKEIDIGNKSIDKRKEQKSKKRCYACRKKLGFFGHECKCSYVFCDEHKPAENHGCDFNYSNTTYLKNTLIDARFEKVYKI